MGCDYHHESKLGVSKVIFLSRGPECSFLIHRFGIGKHACPGIFYAVRKAKLIFSKLVLAYEFKWAGNVVERPPNLSVNG